MKLRNRLLSSQTDHELIAFFGATRLVPTLAGLLELQGGTEAARKEAPDKQEMRGFHARFDDRGDHSVQAASAARTGGSDTIIRFCRWRDLVFSIIRFPLPTIQPATLQDLPSITAIYSHAILHPTATFNTELKTEAEQRDNPSHNETEGRFHRPAGNAGADG